MTESDTKITAKHLMKLFHDGEALPTCGTIDEHFPDTDYKVYSAIDDYQRALDIMEDAMQTIKRLAENEEA